MAISQTVTCDQCGKQKGAVNHWFCGYVSSAVGYMFTNFNPDLASNPQVESFCGRECAHKALAAWMEAQAK